MLNVGEKLMKLIPKIGANAFTVLCFVANRMNKKGRSKISPPKVWKGCGMGKSAYYTAMTKLGKTVDRDYLLQHLKPIKNKEGVYEAQGYLVNTEYLSVYVPEKLPHPTFPHTDHPPTDHPPTENKDAIVLDCNSIVLVPNTDEKSSVGQKTKKQQKVVSKKTAKKEKKKVPPKKKREPTEIWLCMEVYQKFYNAMLQRRKKQKEPYTFNFNNSKIDAAQLKIVINKLRVDWKDNNPDKPVPSGEQYAQEVFAPFLRDWYYMLDSGDRAYWYTKNFIPKQISANLSVALTDMQTFNSDAETNPAKNTNGSLVTGSGNKSGNKFGQAMQANLDRIEKKYTAKSSRAIRISE